MVKDATKRKAEIREYFSYSNQLNMALMVTDPLTDEILFASDALNRLHQVTELCSPSFCYAVYGGGQSERCADCPVPKLSQDIGSYTVWDKYNEALQKWFRNTGAVIPWRDGQNLHIQHMIDITGEKEKEQISETRKGQQALMAAITHEYIGLNENILEQIYLSFKQMGEFFGIDRIMLLHHDEDAGAAVVECAWYAKTEYKPARTRSLAFAPPANECVVSQDVTREPEHAAWREIQVANFLMVPIEAKKESIKRFLSFETCSEPKRIESSHIHIVTVLADSIGASLDRLAVERQRKVAEQRTLLMLNSLPVGAFLVTRDHRLLDCNMAAVRMFQVEDKEYLVNSFFEDFSPAYQPDGQTSRKKAREIINQAFRQGLVMFDWTHQIPNGETIPTEITLVQVPWDENEDLLCAYARDLRQLQEVENKLQEAEAIAGTDALTGVLNRASFMPRAETAFEQCRKRDEYCCLMFLDIDYFKVVNDSFGHAFGDIVLQALGRVLQESVRPEDLCARYGGEEFVLLLRDIDENEAAKIAWRIVKGIRELEFAEYPEFSFTVSIGIMCEVPGPGDCLLKYVEKADTALYLAKDSGRNRVFYYSEV